MTGRFRRFAPAVLAGMAVITLGGMQGCRGKGSTAINAANDSMSPATGRSMSAEESLAAANNAFGFDVFGRLVRQDAAKNVFISPIGIALVLQIAANGAKGDTLAGMVRTLHLQGKSPADVNKASAALQASLVSADPQARLNIASSLWLHKDRARVNPAFVHATAAYHGSDIGDLAGAPDAINAWVSHHTNGKIPSIADPDDYKQMAALIVNAVYFKGKWTAPFEPYFTRSAPFTLLNGANVTVPMMRQSESFPYYKGDNFQAVWLPFGSQRLSMLVVLPDKGVDWDGFLAALNADDLNAWRAHLRRSYGEVGLPRFRSDYGVELKAALSASGMAQAFDPHRADFSGIAPYTYLSYVRHKTFFKVDEQGAEAAAATHAGLVTLSLPPAPSFHMIMDHPFFCAIRDDKTSELLFMGCIVNPNG